MGRYTVEFTKRAAKEYRKISPDYRLLIDTALGKMTKGIPVDIKPVRGEDDVYRIRVGKYRILCQLIDSVLLILKVGPRKDIYR